MRPIAPVDSPLSTGACCFTEWYNRMKRLTVTIPAGRNTPGLRDKIKCLFFDWGFVGLSWKKYWHYRVTVHTKAGQSGKAFGRSRGFRSGYNPDSNTPSHWYNFAHGNSDRVAFSVREFFTEYYTYSYVDGLRPFEGKHDSRSVWIDHQNVGHPVALGMRQYSRHTAYTNSKTVALPLRVPFWWIGLAFFPYAQEGTGPVTTPVTITYEKV